MMAEPPFDPDELYLTKPQLIQIIEAIRNRWKKNKKSNWMFIQAITAFKVSLNLIPDDTISAIFKDILKATNELSTLNQMQRLKGEMPKTQDMVDLVEKKIERGDLF